MSAFDHDAFMREWRSKRLGDGDKISQAEYDLVLDAIGGRWTPAPAERRGEPAWLAIARTLIGQREIPTGSASWRSLRSRCSPPA